MESDKDESQDSSSIEIQMIKEEPKEKKKPIVPKGFGKQKAIEKVEEQD
jgi:hypothetical protein